MSRFHTIRDLDPARLFVLALGTGNAFTRTRYNSSLLLIAGGVGILADCPGPIRRILHDSGRRAGLDIDLPDVGDIILSHLHGDHCNGLEELGFHSRYIRKEPSPPRLFALPEVMEALWEGRLRAAMGGVWGSPDPADPQLRDYFETHPVEEGEVHTIGTPHGDLAFEIRRGIHTRPCFGFVARWRGQSLGYSADTAFDPRFESFLARADLVIHEVGTGAGHTSYESLTSLPAGTRERLLLTHLADEFDASGSIIPILSEGSLYEPGAGREPRDLKDLLA